MNGDGKKKRHWWLKRFSKPNLCKIHEGANDWKDCPNNMNSSKYKGDKNDYQVKGGNKKKSDKKDLHSTTASKDNNSTPVITFKDDNSVILADSNFESDLEEAMMFLEPDKSLHPVTVLYPCRTAKMKWYAW